MKLSEAIEINTHIAQVKALNSRPDEEQAVKLGNEALKRVEFRRERLSWKHEPLLPGETV